MHERASGRVLEVHFVAKELKEAYFERTTLFYKNYINQTRALICKILSNFTLNLFLNVLSFFYANRHLTSAKLCHQKKIYDPGYYSFDIFKFLAVFKACDTYKKILIKKIFLKKGIVFSVFEKLC